VCFRTRSSTSIAEQFILHCPQLNYNFTPSCFVCPFFASNKTKYFAMEVASPLTFDHTVAGAKRQFPCSPFDTTNRSPFGGMESSDEFVQQRSFKRRRFAVDESMEGDSENTVNQSPFQSNSAHQKPFLSSSNGECRSHRRWFLNLFLVNSLLV
jgi:hypothetical protein